jgi:DnaJ-class molecular chaperone
MTTLIIRAPQVVYAVRCKKCLGLGWTREGKWCRLCKGKGHTWVAGPVEATRPACKEAT